MRNFMKMMEKIRIIGQEGVIFLEIIHQIEIYMILLMEKEQKLNMEKIKEVNHIHFMKKEKIICLILNKEMDIIMENGKI